MVVVNTYEKLSEHDKCRVIPFQLSLLLTSCDSGSSKAHFLLSPMSCDALTILLQLLELTGVNPEQVTPILASPLIATVFLVFFLC